MLTTYSDTIRARREAEATRPVRFAAALLLCYGNNVALIPADRLNVVTEARMLLADAGVNPNDPVALHAEIRGRAASGHRLS